MYNSKVKVSLNDPILEIKKQVGRDSVALIVSKLYTDVDGNIIDKSTLPVDLQTNVPYYMFNESDRQGGLFQFAKSVAFYGWKLLGSYIYGKDAIPLLFTGINNIQDYVSYGDLITVYSDSLTAPNYFCFVVLKRIQQSYGSLINSQFPYSFKVNEVQVSTDEEQLKEKVTTLLLNKTGLATIDSFTPSDYINPNDKQRKISILPYEFFPVNSFGLVSEIIFNTNLINWNFNAIKI